MAMMRSTAETVITFDDGLTMPQGLAPLRCGRPGQRGALGDAAVSPVAAHAYRRLPASGASLDQAVVLRLTNAVQAAAEDDGTARVAAAPRGQPISHVNGRCDGPDHAHPQPWGPHRLAHARWRGPRRTAPCSSADLEAVLARQAPPPWCVPGPVAHAAARREAPGARDHARPSDALERLRLQAGQPRPALPQAAARTAAARPPQRAAPGSGSWTPLAGALGGALRGHLRRLRSAIKAPRAARAWPTSGGLSRRPAAGEREEETP